MSLRTRIALALAVASLVLVAAIAVLVYVQARASALEQLSTRLGHLATGMRDRLDTGMYERQQDMRILVDLEAARAAREGSGSLRANLDRRQASHPEFSWIGFTDPQGRVLAATGGLLEGEDVSGRPWWVAAREAEYVGDVHEALLLQRLLRPGAGEPLRFVDIAMPVKESDRVIGVLGAHVAWDWARATADRVLAAGAASADIELLVVGADGKVLLGPKGLEGVPLAGPARGDALSTHLWPDGREWVSVASATRGERSFKGLGWRVVARQPREMAFAALDRLRNVLLMGAVAAAIVASILGYLIASRLAGPLERWAHAADRIGAGDREVQFPEIPGSSELARLSTALRTMAVQLNAKEDALQERISERTSALVEAIGALDAERERLAYALDGSRLAMWDLDIERNEITLSAEWARMLGEPPGEMVMTPVELLERVPEEEHALIRDATIRVLRAEATHYDVDHRVRRNDGQWMWIRSRGRVTRRAADGQALRVNGTNADITARKEHEARLASQAFTDPVTQLPNRRVLLDRLQVAIARAQRAGSRFALAYVDLDGFKAVNDTLGHDGGDELLGKVGERLAACVRAADTVARVGGDEFALLLDPVAAPGDAETVAGKVLAALASPYGLTGGEASVTASVGIALYPDHAADADSLVRAADAAMYRAKALGKNRHCLAG